MPAPPRWRSRLLPVLYAVTLFVGAALLFLVQPLVGKLLLPLVGGSPGVWNTCMVFFQVVLLGGYLYAHRATGDARRPPAGRASTSCSWPSCCWRSRLRSPRPARRCPVVVSLLPDDQDYSGVRRSPRC